MNKFNNQYRSQSHRRQFWDYSAPAAWYLTVVTKNREQHFGEIWDKQRILDEAVDYQYDNQNVLHQKHSPKTIISIK